MDVNTEEPKGPIVTSSAIVYPTDTGYDLVYPDGEEDSVELPKTEEDPGYTEVPEESED